MIPFSKYHALGNSYLVFIQTPQLSSFSSSQIQRLCHSDYGIGSDGILIAQLSQQLFSVRIFNPDGSEAEKSGNGLRILARYLWDCGYVDHRPFQVQTLGGMVTCQVDPAGTQVTVDMGKANFYGHAIPIAPPLKTEVLEHSLEIDQQTLTFSAVSVGNPHCVLIRPQLKLEEVLNWGPKIETHPLFPHRTNVQFVEIQDPHHLKIEIWERGAGHTLSSGSSACAAAAVAYRLKHCQSEIQVHMPGGTLTVQVQPDFNLVLRGPVQKIAAGHWTDS